MNGAALMKFRSNVFGPKGAIHGANPRRGDDRQSRQAERTLRIGGQATQNRPRAGNVGPLGSGRSGVEHGSAGH